MTCHYIWSSSNSWLAICCRAQSITTLTQCVCFDDAPNQELAHSVAALLWRKWANLKLFSLLYRCKYTLSYCWGLGEVTCIPTTLTLAVLSDGHEQWFSNFQPNMLIKDPPELAYGADSGALAPEDFSVWHTSILELYLREDKFPFTENPHHQWDILHKNLLQSQSHSLLSAFLHPCHRAICQAQRM